MADREMSDSAWLFDQRHPPQPAEASDHLDDETLAALFERGLPALDVGQRAHLADCRPCRSAWLAARRERTQLDGVTELATPAAALETAAVEAASAGAESPRRHTLTVRTLALAAVLTVAAGLALLLPGPLADRAEGPLRAPLPAAAPALLEPRGMVAAGDRLRFVWTPVPDAVAYRLAVVDPALGAEVVVRATTDATTAETTTVELTGEPLARLVPARPYAWMLSVERAGGRTETLGPVSFRLAEPGPP